MQYSKSQIFCFLTKVKDLGLNLEKVMIGIIFFCPFLLSGILLKVWTRKNVRLKHFYWHIMIVHMTSFFPLQSSKQRIFIMETQAHVSLFSSSFSQTFFFARIHADSCITILQFHPYNYYRYNVILLFHGYV